MENPIILFLSLIIGLIFLLGTTYILRKIIWFIRAPFFILNRIQWILYNPLRFVFKDYKSSLGYRVYVFLLFTLVVPVYWIFIHVMLTPLRIVNAVYFNVFLFWSVIMTDSITELFHPMKGSYRYEKKAKYIFHWIYAFPYRLVNVVLKNSLAIVEGLLMTGVDIMWPTLTMYHGTSFKGAATDIAHQGRWYVGQGVYAGLGIYFTLNYDVAKHYADSSDHAVILARVTLTFSRNTATLPKDLRGKVGFIDGEGLSAKLPFPWKSIEHWRTNSYARGYEYCIVQPHKSGQYVKTWRARPIAILKNNSPTRVWGGVSLWTGGASGFSVIVVSWLILLYILQLNS